ncbi:MAG: hypothetical protein ACI8Z5_002613, partial [Lentimonas sp.]
PSLGKGIEPGLFLKITWPWKSPRNWWGATGDL